MPPEDLDLERQTFLSNPLVVIAPASHPFARKKKVSLTSLTSQRLILRERGSGTRLACDQHFKRLEFRPDVRLELGSNEAIKQAVAAGMGLAVVSRHALSAHPADEKLAVLQVDGFPIQSSWWILYPKGKRLSPIAAVFLEHLAHNVREWQKEHAR